MDLARPSRALLSAVTIAMSLTGCQKMLAGSEGASAPRTITINGEGFVDARPDLAIVSVGVMTQGPTATAALSDNSKRMSALFELIKALGIESKDVQTSSFSVSPRYAAPDPTRPGSETLIAGYDAHNQLTVRVRDLTKLGDVLDRFVSAAGANNMGGVSFDFANPQPLMDDARKNAVADAQRKARIYAEAAGVKLGAVQSIGEGGGTYYPKPVYAMAERAAMAAPVPVAAGENRVTANVTITFGIE